MSPVLVVTDPEDEPAEVFQAGLGGLIAFLLVLAVMDGAVYEHGDGAAGDCR